MAVLQVVGQGPGYGPRVILLSSLVGPAWRREVEARAPEVPSLEDLFHRHADDVRRIVARLLGPGAPPSDIEDLVQQVFVAASSALPRFRGDSRLTTWLYGLVSHTVLRHLRSRRRHRRMVESLEAMTAVLPTETEHPEAEAARRQALHRVWQGLMQISAKKRVVFLLFEVEGLTGKEIAQALHIKEATVHTRLYHARRDLDRVLEAGEGPR